MGIDDIGDKHKRFHYLPFVVTKTLSISNALRQLTILEDRDGQPPVPPFGDTLVSPGRNKCSILVGPSNIAHRPVENLMDHVVYDRVQKVVPGELEKEVKARRDDAMVHKLQLQKIPYRN